MSSATSKGLSNAMLSGTKSVSINIFIMFLQLIPTLDNDQVYQDKDDKNSVLSLHLDYYDGLMQYNHEFEKLKRDFNIEDFIKSKRKIQKEKEGSAQQKREEEIQLLKAP